MAAAASFACPKLTPFCYPLPKYSHGLLASGQFNEQFWCKSLSLRNSFASTNSTRNRNFSRSVGPNLVHPLRVGSEFQSSTTPWNAGIILPPPMFRCSLTNSAASADSDSPTPLSKIMGSLSPDSLSKLTPTDIWKGCLALCIAVAVSKRTVNVLFNPFFWMYFSWTWLFWPWIAALALAIYGFYCFNKHLKGSATIIEQLAVVTSVFTWLTLVPPAHFNGFLEGWPFVFFLAYHYFFFLNISVRKRLYGDLYARAHDPKWDLTLPNLNRILFCAGVFVGHWLAAFEGVELHLTPSGLKWSNVGIWVLILVTILMQYHSTLYLAKYSEKVVVPTAVVQFGPYRFVRHPIYASTMLLFVSYFTALRAPLSALFIVGVCLVYYGRKAKLEEATMVETFGERYTEYMARVRYQLIPFVY